MLARDRVLRVTLAVLLIALGFCAYTYRRAFIQAIFLDGPSDGPRPLLAAVQGERALGLAPVERVRVVLIDGLGQLSAMHLPSYSALCSQGYDLILDTGFPTVSLPVQHVLWTGLTQQQTGIMFRGKKEILERPLPPPARGIPAQVPESMAIAESHAYIVHALGFAEVMPPSPTELPVAWAELGFMAAAQEAILSPRPLVFVHLLGVDVAGHKHGSDSPAYDQATRQADDMLGRLWAADQAAHPTGTRWFLLSDHGHRGQGLYGRPGGHGGSEPHIRQVRACIAGELKDAPPIPGGTYLHLVDYARAIADSLGAELSPESAGRPLYLAAGAPAEPDATLPSPSRSRWIAALIILFVAALTTGWAASRSRALLPWWWPVAILGVIVMGAPPELSVPMVYQPLGRVVYVTALPGLAFLAILAGRSLEHQPAVRVVLGQMTLPVAGMIATAILAGGKGALDIALGLPGEPPLMPGFTAYTSVLAVLVYAGAVVCTLALLVTMIPGVGPRPRRRQA